METKTDPVEKGIVLVGNLHFEVEIARLSYMIYYSPLYNTYFSCMTCAICISVIHVTQPLQHERHSFFELLKIACLLMHF